MSNDWEIESLPLWEQADELEQMKGVCEACGELTNEPDDRFCDECWEIHHDS